MAAGNHHQGLRPSIQCVVSIIRKQWPLVIVKTAFEQHSMQSSSGEHIIRNQRESALDDNNNSKVGQQETLHSCWIKARKANSPLPHLLKARKAPPLHNLPVRSSGQPPAGL